MGLNVTTPYTFPVSSASDDGTMHPSSPLTHMNHSDAAQTLFQARAMLWVHIKGKDLSGAGFWDERLRNIAAAILSTHSR